MIYLPNVLSRLAGAILERRVSLLHSPRVRVDELYCFIREVVFILVQADFCLVLDVVLGLIFRQAQTTPQTLAPWNPTFKISATQPPIEPM